MGRFRTLFAIPAFLAGVFVTCARAQTTYHLHEETFGSYYLLKTTGPDASATTLNWSLLDCSGCDTYPGTFISQYTNSYDIVSGTTINFKVWAAISSSTGTYYPWAELEYEDSHGVLHPFCVATGSSAVTTTMTSYQIGCSTTTAFTAGGYLFLIAGLDQSTGPGRRKVSGELGVEGTLNGANDSQFTVPAPPTPRVSGLSPTSGAEGTAITISGSYFGATQGSSAVAFNGVSASATAWSDSSITASVPGSTTSGNVVVTVAGNASNGVSFTVIPSLTSLSPTSGGAGTSVTITGYDFGSSQGSSTVTFNGTGASPTNWSATQIVAPAPTGASGGPVVVTVGGQASNGITFGVTPSISSLSPTSGIAGTSVTIAGNAFGATQGTSTVAFNGAPASPTNWSNSSISAGVPTNATTGNVVVTVSGTASNGVSFTVPPAISALSPSSGGAGSFVTINGTGFGPTLGTSTVTFNGAAAEPAKWNATAIVVPVPSNATTGAVVVTVSSVASNGVTFTFAATGTVSGAVTSSGSGVGGVTVEALQSGSVAASATTASSGAYSLNNLAAGLYTLEAFAPGYLEATQTGVSLTAGQTVTVNLTLGAPTISTLAPAGGPAGIAVTINGSNFGSSQGTSTVTFNGAAASPTSWGNTAIVVPVPSGATSGPVVITVSAVASNGVAFSVGVGTVSGAVTQAGNGSAVSGASVQVLQANAVQGSATTDANGNYSVSNLNSGSYDLKVSATGLGTALQSGLAVTAGNTTTANVAMPAAGTLSGTVTQSNGTTPISGATVNVLEGTDAVGSATTNTSGNYSIATLAAGTYTAQASAPGYNLQNQTGVSVTANNTTTENFSLAGQDAVAYAYDDLGRLIAVTDAQTSTAVYSYDAVGNLLSIGVNPSSTVSVIGFSPQSGSAGTTVTIDGTGFSATASQDSVSFNGTSAAIASASTTQIVASVPSGATSGTIKVTAPAGNATSAQPFSVTTSGAPTITSFTPAIATPGTALSISGTNFDTVAAHDSTRLNVSAALITSATSTSLSTAVPVTGTSGHLSVTTAAGRAVSTGYEYVPPAPYTASSVEFTGVLGFGTSGSLNVNMPTANGIGLVVFDATGGQRVSATWTNGNFGICGLIVTLLSPNGSTLFYNNCWDVGLPSDGDMDTLTLPETGAYTFLLTLRGTDTGSGTLTLYNVADISSTVAPGSPGAYVPLTIATPGQNARYQFSGSAGQLVSVVFASGTGWTTCGIHASILAPDGTTLAANNCIDSGGWTVGEWISTQALRLPGTYTLFIDPQGANTGATSFQVNFVTNITGTVAPSSPGGSATPAPNITVPGQSALYTFSATAGQQVSIYQQNVTLPGACPVSLYILNPDGTQAYSNTCAGNPFFSGAVGLNQTGSYTLKLTPNGAGTGTATETMYLVPPPVTGSFTLNGASTGTLAITTPGQVIQATFSGSANQLATLSATSNSIGCIYVNVYAPGSQSSLNSNNNYDCYSNYTFSQLTLPSTGTYTVIVTPNTANTGSVTISGTSP